MVAPPYHIINQFNNNKIIFVREKNHRWWYPVKESPSCVSYPSAAACKAACKDSSTKDSEWRNWS